jgi:hypothetical protein
VQAFGTSKQFVFRWSRSFSVAALTRKADLGRLTLDRSEPGLGTCFALDLPLAKSSSINTTATDKG